MKRFYLAQPFAPGATLPLPEHLTHRLRHVLRMGAGEALHLFNHQGELAAATLADAKARGVTVTAMLPTPPALPPLTLALGVPKREAWESALRQATELGATSIIPLKTEFAQVGKLNAERAQSILIEAAEQSERTSIPVLAPLTPFHHFLATLAHPCAWAYERSTTLPAPLLGGVHAVLVGPEGGFSPAEVTALQNNENIKVFSLGPTILRTDTAVVAALAHIRAST